MRRLFGTIGLTDLTVLAVAYFLYDSLTITILACAGAVVVVAGVIGAVRRYRYYPEIIAGGLSVLAATLSIFLYWNIAYQPILRDYSEKEISIHGYICDEIVMTPKQYIVPLETETIDGQPCRTRISLTLYDDDGWEAFDEVDGTMTVYPETSHTRISKGFFLQAEQDEKTTLRSTGSHHFSLYQYAVSLRIAIKQQLSTLLNRESAGLCRAIFLGDKPSLDRSERHDFSRTGTTYLIVVSGLHLSVICGLASSLLKKLKWKRLPVFLVMTGVVVLFSALTGFSRSVIRAGIMLILAHVGGLTHRKYDSLNSMGVAALFLSLGNPFVVGDWGVLLSFSATTGIVLWAPAIDRRVYRFLRIELIPFAPVRRALHAAVNLFCVSLSASLWVLPVSILAFQRFSPLVILTSCLTSPLTFMLLVLILLLLAFSLIPFARALLFFLTAPIELICRLYLTINHWFAVLPFAFVRADKPFLWIWVIVSAVLTAVGYLIHAGKRYILSAVALSLCVLTVGWSLTALTDSHPVELMIFSSGNGTTVAVGRDSNLSLLSSGGSQSGLSTVIDELYAHGDTIDYLVIPNNRNYASYLSSLGDYFQIEQPLVNRAFADKIPAENACLIDDNTAVSLRLNSVTTEELLCVNEVVYQYLHANGKTVLYIPHGGDAEKLPAQYRTADWIIMDHVCRHPELLDCHELIYTGLNNSRLQQHLAVLEEIADEVTLLPKGRKIICI